MFFLPACNRNSMGKLDSIQFPRGREFLDELSPAHTNLGDFNSNDDEGFDKEEAAAVLFPQNGDGAMIDITENHCQTFFLVTRVDGEKVAVV